MNNTSVNGLPKISFGIIVLNGEPFTRYCIRQLYSHAHEIIIVEGGSMKARHVCPDGSSNDGTLEVLEDMKLNEDPENKIIVIKKNNGFWKDKDEQSQAYAKRATGDYLWQIDIDEFYKDEDIVKVKNLLCSSTSIDSISFRQITFWGAIKYWCNSVYLTSVNASEYHRLFKWGAGYKYVAHRPPTVVDSNGINLREKNWLKADVMEKMNVNLYHYSLLFPKQVKDKCMYYSTPGESFKSDMDLWAEKCYFKITKRFKVHNVEKYPSWIMRYKGSHPGEVYKLLDDATNGIIDVELRNTEDIEKLLSSISYKIFRCILISIDNTGFFKLGLFFKSFFKSNS